MLISRVVLFVSTAELARLWELSEQNDLLYSYSLRIVHASHFWDHFGRAPALPCFACLVCARTQSVLAVNQSVLSTLLHPVWDLHGSWVGHQLRAPFPFAISTSVAVILAAELELVSPSNDPISEPGIWVVALSQQPMLTSMENDRNVLFSRPR